MAKWQMRGYNKPEGSARTFVVKDADTKMEAINAAMDFVGVDYDKYATITRWADNKITDTIRAFPKPVKPVQETMFKNGEDLPLFSNSNIRARDESFRPEPVASRNYLPGMRPTFDELAKAHQTKRSNQT